MGKFRGVTVARLAVAGVLMLAGLGAAQAQVVISQAYGGGGNSGATLKNDFIELHNNTSAAVSVDGWSVQYASSTGTSWQVTTLAGSIAPGSYYLIQQNAGSGGTDDLPTPDATGSISMSGSNGKVALVAATAALNGACPTGNIDFVGYGSANCAEGSAPTPGLSNTTAALRNDGGCSDSDNNAADFTVGTPTPRNSAATPKVCGGGGQPVLSAANVELAEGASGTTAFNFTLSLSQPAGAGGVGFDVATSDGTATAGSDYAAIPTTPVTIAAGDSSAIVTVQVNGDAANEPDETFFLDVSNVTGAIPAALQATGTILNDDFNLVSIHAIQGAGDRSPLVGQIVATSGIVTAVRNAGFFLQTPDAEADANPLTSEGVYVYTGSAPPAAAAVGNRVNVQATVQEYVPSQDPNQPPLTELSGSPSIVLVSSGNPLPTPVALTPTFPDPAGAFDQLERLEGMRVTAASLTVNTPTLGNVNETSATATGNGVFHAVVTGVPRAYREPGFQLPDPLPGGDNPAIPRWDTNPELIAVSSGALGGDRVDVASGCLITGNATGPLDYSFRRYTLYPETTLQVQCDGADVPKPAPTPTPDDISVASYNLERFFDDQNDPAIGEPVLTPAAYQGRLNKASLGIRNYLHAPDIVAVEEMENLTVLQALAARISSDAIAAGQPDPQYAAYLEEGNDVGGIDVGFLVKTADAAPGKPRVETLAVTQFGKATTWVEPAGGTSLLNDRPPLLLQAIVHFNDGRSFPLSVLVVHQRSLNGSDGDDANGVRVRAKRQKQAEFVANLVQSRQTADPTERLLVLGDFNAFEFNDGLTDVMGTITGLPSADAATVVPGDGVDLVNPDLDDLTFLQPPEQSYSFAFDGNVQSLDHVVANAALMSATDLATLAIGHARLNADFPATARNDAATPTRLSDHDPALVLLRLKAAQSADLGVAASVSPASVLPGETANFRVDIANTGPSAAAFAAVAFVFDKVVAPTVTPASGWACAAAESTTTTTTVTCAIDSLAAGSAQTFNLAVQADAAQAGSTLTMAASVVSQTPDTDSANNNDTVALAIRMPQTADLSLSIDGPATLRRGQARAQYTLTLKNLGQIAADQPLLVIDGNALVVAAKQLRPPNGWACRVLPGAQPGERGVPQISLSCRSTAPLAPDASARFVLDVHARPTPSSGTITVEGAASTPTPEARLDNNQAAISTIVQ